MSWQDDLRQLDTALAEGRISPDDYRRRRDELLAGASSAPPAQPGAPAPASPFGQPFRWEAQPPAATNPDATQVVGNPAGPANPDATRVVSDPNKDSERTQYVRPVTPPQGQPVGQPAGGWPPSGPPQPAATPWGGNDMYTPVDQPPGWIAQGPEVFDDSPSSGKGKRIGIIVGVVVLLAAIGTGVYLFTGNGGSGGGGNNQGGGDTSAAPTSTTKPKPTDPYEALLEEIPKLNAKTAPNSGVLTTDELVSKKVLSQAEAQILTEGQVTKTAWRGATKSPAVDGKGTELFNVVVIPTADEAAATRVSDQLLLNQRANGYINIAEPLPNMPPAVVFDKKILPEVGVYRGIYISGKNVVLVEITQNPLLNEASLSGSYQDQMKAMMNQFAPVQ
ncbi:hypothetical protein [Saccharothrix variisporea]|uniref:Flagellar basal body-associated protein FliL n=1 Tax=Saccharothrix variisporea TaxID=543527 RepID=A0A495XDX1_9PSEU|nr:hypothetical protein [Saccharothrix variisporea]RKT71466.1 hypothetical protein DFJ66_4756 [Saccharothrix variisporea]